MYLPFQIPVRFSFMYSIRYLYVGIWMFHSDWKEWQMDVLNVWRKNKEQLGDSENSWGGSCGCFPQHTCYPPLPSPLPAPHHLSQLLPTGQNYPEIISLGSWVVGGGTDYNSLPFKLPGLSWLTAPKVEFTELLSASTGRQSSRGPGKQTKRKKKRCGDNTSRWCRSPPVFFFLI